MSILSGLANKFFAKRGQIDPLNVPKSIVGTADAGLRTNPEERPGIYGSFLLKQAAGPDRIYTTREEAKEISKLAYLKFASVSLVTFSAMKALSPVFDNSIVTNLPQIANTDPKILLLGATSVATWCMFSQLDSAVMKGLRDKRTADYLANHHGIKDPNPKKGNNMGLWYRFGISAGSLAISLPALWVSMSERSLEEFNKDRHREYNAPIVEKYQGELNAINDLIARLENNDADLKSRLRDTVALAPVATDIQLESIQRYQERILFLEQKIIEQENILSEQDNIRNEAQIRADWEESGVNGLQAGRGQKWEDAMADVDAAILRMQIISEEIQSFKEEINVLRGRISSINTDISQETNQTRDVNEQINEDLQAQIERNSAELSAQIALRAPMLDVQARAEADPNYNHLNPDIMENSKIYVQYMLENPNILTWGSAIGLALLISCAELLVFYQSANKKVNLAEERAALAHYMNSTQSRNIFGKKMMEMGLESDILDAEVLEKIKISALLKIDQELFQKLVDAHKDDPEFQEQMLHRIKEFLKEIQFNKKPTPQDHDQTKANGSDYSHMNGHMPSDVIKPK